MSTEYPLRTVGRIKYDPDRGKMKKRREWWCVIELTPGLCGYLRWQYHNHWWEYEPVRRTDLFAPAFHDHCTLIRGEIPEIPKEWRYRDGEIVEIFYNNTIHIGNQSTHRGDVLFYHVNCHVPVAKDIRSRLGLPSGRFWNGVWKDFHYHITIGKNVAS